MRVSFSMFVVAVLSAPVASATTLYSTSFEAPAFTDGPLGSQGGWAYQFGSDYTVTSAFSRTGNQSVALSGTALFGQNTIVGPFSDAAPQISVKHSVYLDASADWSDTFITFGLSGAPGSFLGQLSISNGSVAVLGNDADISTVPINRGEWISLELLLDFPSQTMEGFVNGMSIGSGPFANPATQVSNGDLFFTNFGGQSISFYVDDVSLTAIPEPATLALLAGAGLLALRRR